MLSHLFSLSIFFSISLDLKLYILIWRRIWNTSDRDNVGNSNGRTPAAVEPAPTSSGSGLKCPSDEDDACWQRLVSREKRVFAAPKTAVPVESRRQRAQQVGDNRLSLNLMDGTGPSAIPPAPPPPPPPDAAAIASFPLQRLTDIVENIDSTVRPPHSLPESEPVRSSVPSSRSNKVINNPGGFFRQILSEDDDDDVVYQVPQVNQVTSSNEPAAVAVGEESVYYTEPSMRSVSSVASFGERPAPDPSGFAELRANDSTSCYADPFEHYASSLLDHNYEDMDDDEYHRLSLPFIRLMRDRAESGVSVSSSGLSSDGSRPSHVTCSSSDSGANMTIPPGFARSRAALFESIAKANQRVIRPDDGLQGQLVQALGPQLALYSLCSLRPPSSLSSSQVQTLSKSCPSSINWIVDGCADNDGFFMEFANQRIALPDRSANTSATSFSSLDSSSTDGLSTKTESSGKSKSDRKVSFVLDPPPLPAIGSKTVTGTIQHTLASRPRSLKSISKSSTCSSTALSLSRFFKQTFVLRCGDGQPSDTESLMSHPIDDLLSQSDLEMFCKSDHRFDGDDSGTDVTTPDSSLYHFGTDIDKTLSMLEVKAKTSLAGKLVKLLDDCSESCSSCDDDSDSDSCSSSCESSCCLTDCASWNSWINDSSSSDVRCELVE